MRFALTLLAAVALATPAAAVLAPQYYQQARDQAVHVVTFEVTGVAWTEESRGYGQCLVSGKVLSVERGPHYRVGGDIRVKVPCMGPDAEPMAGGVLWQTPAELKASRRGKAWMTAPGELALYQYEILGR